MNKNIASRNADFDIRAVCVCVCIQSREVYVCLRGEPG